MKRHMPIIALTILVLAVYVMLWLVGDIARQSPYQSLGRISDTQMKAIEISVEVNKWLLSLAILVVGGIGAIITRNNENLEISSKRKRMLIVASFLFASLSLVSGYGYYSLLIELLSYNVFDPNSLLAAYSRGLQFVCLVISVLLFGGYLIEIITPISGAKANVNAPDPEATAQPSNKANSADAKSRAAD